MWIAKNSLTGYEYTKKFVSIYDCQSYIDKELIIVEYLCQRIKVLEDYVDDDAKFDIWYKDRYGDSGNVAISIFARIEYALKDFINDLNSDSKPSVLTDNYTSNKIIRCWYVEQQRFATGFDF